MSESEGCVPVAEAARIVKPGGTIAFTDWVEGPAGLSDEEAGAFLQGMKFPSVQDIEGYRSLLESNGCEVAVAEDTGRFAPYVDLYLQMADMQLTYDALKILGFDLGQLETVATGSGSSGSLPAPARSLRVGSSHAGGKGSRAALPAPSCDLGTVVRLCRRQQPQ